jgi:hypothetical protein
LAIAYSNLDGSSGYQQRGADVLVAKLVDANSDGVASAGDRVVTGNYPVNFGASSFAGFSNSKHTVLHVSRDEPGPGRRGRIEVVVAGGTLEWANGELAEGYLESTEQGFALMILDGLASGVYDTLFVSSNAPSGPTTPDIDQLDFSRPGDTALIDVEA